MGEPGRRSVIGGIWLVCLVAFICTLAPDPAVAARPVAAPMTFEPNVGQADEAVKFLARGRGYGLFLTPTESVLVLASAQPGRSRTFRMDAGSAEPVVVRMRLVGADPAAAITGLDPRSARSHYLLVVDN